MTDQPDEDHYVWAGMDGRVYASVDEIADEICRATDRRSSVILASTPYAALQRLVVLKDGKLERVGIHFDPDDPRDNRGALKSALFRRRRLVCDYAFFKTRTDDERQALGMFRKRRDRVALGVDLPSDFKTAFLIHWRRQKDSDSAAAGQCIGVAL